MTVNIERMSYTCEQNRVGNWDKITGISFATSIPTSVPRNDAADIIQGFISDQNGKSDKVGTYRLESLTVNEMQDCFCFTVSVKASYSDNLDISQAQKMFEYEYTLADELE